MRRFTHVLLHFLARLACVRHAASVDSEPGSNSQVILQFDLSTLMTELLKIHQRLRTLSIVKELWLSGPKLCFWRQKNRLLVLGGFLWNPLSDAQVAKHIQRS